MRLKYVINAWPCLVSIVSLVLLAVIPGMALAHDTRNIGQYRLTVGFIVEPAFEGQKNGVDLRVLRVQKEGDKEVTTPVEGLEKTLQVEITHVSTGVSKTFALRTIFRDPGHYTNDIVFTAPGVYQMRFFGTIEGAAVNETFVSRGGGGNFNDMQSSADMQFPERFPEMREVSAAVRGVEDTADQAQDSASSARTMALIGIVVGAVGVVSGLGAVVATTRKR